MTYPPYNQAHPTRDGQPARPHYSIQAETHPHRRMHTLEPRAGVSWVDAA